MEQNRAGRSPSGRATRASTEPQERLGHSASVPNAVADKLREAKALVERGWCQQAFESNDGELRCAAGAIIAVNPAEDVRDDVFGALMTATGVKWTTDLWAWNDAPERTQAQVIAAFDKAIALAEQVSA